MKGNLNMANNRIFNLPAPTGSNQPTPLVFTDLKYVARDGSSTMTNNLNMDNKKIINLRVRFFKKIQIRILESKNGFCVSLIKSENGF